MSMSEPLLPHPSAAVDRTAAAEPGHGGPPPGAPEEPDVLPPQSADDGEPQPELPAETPFRTPTPGERLHPADLAGDGDAGAGATAR
jgi:hypothetical protein